MAESGFKITNIREVQKFFKTLDPADKNTRTPIRRLIKKPFLPILSQSRSNLTQQRSTRTWNLFRSLMVRTSFNKRLAYFSVAFGANTKGSSKKASEKEKEKSNNKGFHFHLVNIGTRRRYHKSWKYVGAVGKGKKRAKNDNPLFRVGFADRAIKNNLGRIENILVMGLKEIYDKITKKANG